MMRSCLNIAGRLSRRSGLPLLLVRVLICRMFILHAVAKYNVSLSVFGKMFVLPARVLDPRPQADVGPKAELGCAGLLLLGEASRMSRPTPVVCGTASLPVCQDNSSRAR